MDMREQAFGESNGIRFIQNPLPGPKKHVPRQLEYDIDVPDDQLFYDIDVLDTDDFDLE